MNQRMLNQKMYGKTAKVTLERRFFAVNAAGENEFDWVLFELGIPKQAHSEIDEIEVDIELKNISFS
jgi:hypothetical protein